MKAYVVGGAVRDRLLGSVVNDRDWVVVGATPQELLAAGYTPVGRDFPVFLHPTTREQYALARTERKAGPGYHGFMFHAAPDVTLQQDLARRDLTINAIAEDPDSGELIDPFGGRHDIQDRVLRHVSEAFAEDPVRLLRLARFAARWPDFNVAPATLALLQQLVDAGEVDALVPERVWQELARGLTERAPSRMVELLRSCGALARLAPELDRWLRDDRQRAVALLQMLDGTDAALPLRFACLCHGLDGTNGDVAPGQPALRALCERWRVDTECRDIALLVAREWPALRARRVGDAPSCLALLERADAWRRPERIGVLIAATDALATLLPAAQRGRAQRQGGQLRAALQAAQAVSTATLAPAKRLAVHGEALGRALRQARLEAIAEAFARS
jgi:tRNA nucleotidyltransferase (CCA-adding enzyme)